VYPLIGGLFVTLLICRIAIKEAHNNTKKFLIQGKLFLEADVQTFSSSGGG
jgi:hypothetical protein